MKGIQYMNLMYTNKTTFFWIEKNKLEDNNRE